MNRMALDSDARAEVFIETANRLGISPLVVEKDFWMCWTLWETFRESRANSFLLIQGRHFTLKGIQSDPTVF